MADKGICKLSAISRSPECNKGSIIKIQDIEAGVGNKQEPFRIWNFSNEAHGDLLWDRKGV